jgi:hypothetical protein
MGSGKLRQMQERILEKRIEKIKKLYPDMAIARISKSNLPIMPKKLGGEAKRFTIRGKITYMEKVQDRLFCTISDGTGLFAVEMENMLLNVEIEQGQLFSIVCRLKISPDGAFTQRPGASPCSIAPTSALKICSRFPWGLRRKKKPGGPAAITGKNRFP